MQSTLVKGRPPSSPPSIFRSASKLFAFEETCGTKTTISAYTSIVQELTDTRFRDLQPVFVICLNTSNHTAHDQEDGQNDDTTPDPEDLQNHNTTPDQEDGENDDAASDPVDYEHTTLCPWVAEPPYYMSWWDHSHVRIDSKDNPTFWCVCPVELLPTPMASYRQKKIIQTLVIQHKHFCIRVCNDCNTQTFLHHYAHCLTF